MARHGRTVIQRVALVPRTPSYNIEGVAAISSLFDAHGNFAYGTVATPPSPANTGTTLTLGVGLGARFPSPPFNVVIWPVAAMPLLQPAAASVSAQAEIARVTAMSGDQITAMTRGTEGTPQRTILSGDQIMAAITVKTLTDIESVIANGSIVPWNMLAGQTLRIPANYQMAAPAGITSAEPTGMVMVIDGIGVS